jgi:hypothetical protein
MLPRPPEEPTFSRKALILAASAIIIMVAALVITMLGLRHYQKLLNQRKASVAVPAAQPPAPTNSPIATPPPEAGTVESDFRVSPIALEKQTGSSLVYAVGTVKNLLDKQRFGVKLELELDDAAGQKIGLARDYQQILEPGGEWKFKALVVESKASSARLASIHEQP